MGLGLLDFDGQIFHCFFGLFWFTIISTLAYSQGQRMGTGQ